MRLVIVTIILCIIVGAIFFYTSEGYKTHLRVEKACEESYLSYRDMRTMQENLYLMGKIDKGDLVGKVNEKFKDQVDLACL